MSAASSSTVLDEVRERILDAAEARFRQFGYGKTTMTEIAGDVAMSAANIYRYFQSKQELGAACCSRWMQERVDVLRVAVRGGDRSAAQRLEDFVIANLHFTHKLASEQPRVHEMVENMTRERPDLVHDKIAAVDVLLAELIAYGNTTAEFDVDDVQTTAAHVHAAIVLFEVPIFAHLYSLEYFETTARGVAGLLVRGLGRR